MASLETQIEGYARLILSQGVNLQPGQALSIRAELVHRDFVRLLTQTAYSMGARYVEIDWQDPVLDRIRAKTSALEHLTYAPDYLVQRGEDRLQSGWASISITGREDPDVFEGVDAAAMQQMYASFRAKLRSYYKGVMANQIAWCVCAASTPAWAQQVFPDAAPAEAETKLWAAILAAARADQDDPSAAWQAHQQKMGTVAAYLNRNDVRTLHFVDDVLDEEGKPRTNLTIGLTDKPLWLAGGSKTATGIEFSPNIPTEETFSTPHRLRTEGWVRTSMPFFTLEQKVEDAYFRFEEGKLVAFHAATNEAVLTQFFDVPGTRYLGEIALVDVNSPIYRSGILFYDTLFDENAACHIAFGRAYPNGLQGSEALNDDELLAAGVNDSPLHQDIMFGSPTLRLTGTCADGRQIPIMAQGRYVDAIFDAIFDAAFSEE
jgi:aminopeptidase